MSNIGWSKSAILYSKAPAASSITPGSPTYNPIAANAVRNCSLQADFPVPGPYTVQFSIDSIRLADNPTVQTGVINPVAEVVWTVKGNAVRRLVSVSNGVQISGTGQAVSVTIRDELDPSLAVFPATYNVGILVTPGTRPSQTVQPTYRVYARDGAGAVLWSEPGSVPIAGGPSTVTIPVPQNAGANAIFAVADFAASYGLVGPYPRNAFQLLQQAVGGASSIYSILDRGWVPLAQNIDNIQLLNNLPAGAGNGALFMFAFGIDG